MNKELLYSKPGSFLKGILLLVFLIAPHDQVAYAQATIEEKVLVSVVMRDTVFIKDLYIRALKLSRQKPDSAIYLFKQGIALSRAQNYIYGQALHLLALAHITGQQGHPELGISWFKSAKFLCVMLERPAIWMKYYQCGNYLYDLLGYRDTALQYAYNMLDICNKFPQSDSAEVFSALAYGRLGVGYMKAEANPLLAISYFNKALQIAERNGSREQYPFLYTGLAGSWVNENTLDSTNTEGYRKGAQLYFKAMRVAQELDDKMALAVVYFNLGGVYCNLNNFDSAAFYLEKMSGMPDEVINYNGKIVAYVVMATGLHKEQQYTKAAYYYALAGNLARKHNAKSRLQEIERHQFALYRSMGRYKEAMEHLERYTNLRDSLLDEEKIKATSQLEVKYRIAQKDKELARKDLRLLRQHSALKEKNIWIGAGGLSSLLLAGLLLVWRRNSQHRRKLQERQIHVMEQDQALWKQGENIRNLNAMIRGEEKERARLGRELHDGIVSELVAIKMNFDTLQLKYPLYEAESEYEKALQHLDATARELRKTAQNLMPDILTEHGLRMSLIVYCEKTAALTGLNINFVCEDHLPQLPLDFELSLYRMVQELVLNILKHAQASSALVQLNYHTQLLMLTIEDNGKGIDIAQAKLSGIGLSNLKSRVEALQGRFDIRARKSRGTAVYVEFDLPLLQSMMSDENKNSYS